MVVPGGAAVMENMKIVDQRLRAGPASEALGRLAALESSRSEAVARLMSDNAALLTKQGAVVAAWRWRGGRRLGPYYSIHFRDALGRQRAIYLGPEGELVVAARRALVELQTPRRLKRRLAEARRALAREAAAARREMDDGLQRLGLRRQGHEIRGWSRRSTAAGADERAATSTFNSSDSIPNADQ
jgi:hypothetical protein